MAKIVSKGTKIEHNPGGGLVTVASVISVEHSGAENIMYDSTDLLTSGPGKESAWTGLTEPGTLDLELFYDPALATLKTLLADFVAPVDRAWLLTFSDNTTAVFNVSGMAFGFSVSLEDGLKGTLSLTLDQLLTYPT